jgi:glucuronokinase
LAAAIEVTGRAFARAALLGNPSDGYGGKTLGFVVRAFAAEATASEAPEPRLAAEAGARELVAATLDRFERLCHDRRVAPLTTAIRLETSIPRQVGLGGSSAIVIATLRALCALHRIELEPSALAELALAVEAEDLGIAAGPQDRVIQAHEGLVYMDFGGDRVPAHELLDEALLPATFIAYMPSAESPSGAVHGGLRRRFERGDPDVVEAMAEIAALAEAGRRHLLEGDRERVGALMSANVAARARMLRLDPRHLRLIEIARSLGAPANYAGSGGAIVGLVPDGASIEGLRRAFAAEGCGLVVAA